MNRSLFAGMLFALAFSTMGARCQTVGAVNAPFLAEAPAQLLEPCLRPMALPKKGGLTQEQAEEQWIRDRARLVACANRHGNLAQYYTSRDEALAKDRYMKHSVKPKAKSRRYAERPVAVAPTPRVRVIRGASSGGSIW